MAIAASRGIVTAIRACGVLSGRVSPTRMNKVSYSGYRFPPEIIQQAIWLYLRFTLSLRDVEDLLAERVFKREFLPRPVAAHGDYPAGLHLLCR